MYAIRAVDWLYHFLYTLGSVRELTGPVLPWSVAGVRFLRLLGNGIFGGPVAL